ncbi:hypothetical protein [Lysobacter antibioticus]|uniref:hypothetical protein n=1 Tax=Lysobacter antibioticus TaxID=84531 RepID=UPI00118743AA|nr:hypothetical protein [Lysobacter antibioticus]
MDQEHQQGHGRWQRRRRRSTGADGRPAATVRSVWGSKMNCKKVLVLTMLVWLGGCEVASRGPGATAPADKTAAPVKAAAAAAGKTGVACPSQQFDAFLAAFMDDVAIQKAFTASPLQSETVDANADPEPRPVTTMLDATALRFPVMPGAQQQQRDGLVLSQTELNGDKEVMLAKPDTDYQMSFFFKKGECWTLYRTRDDSL